MAQYSGINFPRRINFVAHQVERVRVLLSSLIGSNPFYTRILEEAGVSYKIRDLSEFGDRIPLTTRAQVLEDQRTHPPFGSNLTFPLTRYARCYREQDLPDGALRWLDTIESWDVMVRNEMDILEAAGLERGQRVYFPVDFEQDPNPWLAIEAAMRLGGLCLCGGGLSRQVQLERMIELGANVIYGSLPGVLELVETALASHFDLQQLPVRLIVVTQGTAPLSQLDRDRLTQVWPGPRVSFHFALAETGPAACECPEHPGWLHILETAHIAEVIDPSTLRPVESGEKGELVLTTLFREGSPLLRYRTGLLVKTSLDTRCDCGRQYLTLEGGILGPIAGSAPVSS